MRPDIQTGSRIKVTDRKSAYYRMRGVVKSELTQCSLIEPDSYEVVGFICRLNADCPDGTEVALRPDQVACIQKKFVDIEHIREQDETIGTDSSGNDIVRSGNTGAFEPGDIIQITTKIDGANASISWNEDEGRLEAFSRTSLLDGVDGLRGFKPYVQTTFKPDEFKKCPDLVIFGEWMVPHSIRDYGHGVWNTWKVYDIWSKTRREYLPQDEVKAFCADHDLEYIHELYYGPFISWEHCRSFMHADTYGPTQEGIVVKNQTKLSDQDVHFPKYLKIVNDKFKETHRAKERRPTDPGKKREMDESRTLMASVVTEARVRKIVLNLADTGIIPADLTPECMGTVMKSLPKAVFDDVLKEEPDTVRAAGAYAGKFCSAITAEIARKIIIGK